MEKVYIVFHLSVNGGWYWVAEFKTIKECNVYLSQENYRVIDGWKKAEKK
jgi:hypothetical protein